jgi:hypothetical protein
MAFHVRLNTADCKVTGLAFAVSFVPESIYYRMKQNFNTYRFVNVRLIICARNILPSLNKLLRPCTQRVVGRVNTFESCKL